MPGEGVEADHMRDGYQETAAKGLISFQELGARLEQLKELAWCRGAGARSPSWPPVARRADGARHRYSFGLSRQHGSESTRGPDAGRAPPDLQNR